MRKAQDALIANPATGHVADASVTAGRRMLAQWLASPAPTVRAVMVAALNGALTGADGVSGSLGGPADTALFATLRSVADALIVGAGTARTEGYGPWRPHPDLQAWRQERGLPPAPHLYVLSASGDVPRQLRESPDVTVLGSLTPRAVLDVVRSHGHRVINVEGGPRVWGDFFAAGAIDQLCLSQAHQAPPLNGAPVMPFIAGSLLARDLLTADGVTFTRFDVTPA